MNTEPTGRVRGSTIADLQPGDADARLGVNGRGDVLVANSLPCKSELIRLGNSYTCTIATGSAYTNVAGWPSTRAELVLWNGEAAGGKSYVIDSAFVASISSITAASALTLIAQLAPSLTAPTDDTAQLIVSRSGKVSYGGKAKRAVAVTTATANKWEVLGTVPAGASASIGLAAFADMWGGWIVPPGGALFLNAVAGTATGTSIIGVTWSEVQLALG